MLRRLSVVGLVFACACTVLLAPPRAAAGPFLVPQQMKLVAYYPARDGWTYMWGRWRPRTIDRDLALLASLNANTVRIFLQPVAFEFPRPDPQAAAKLDTVLALAARHGLRVELSLFDWWFDYGRIADSEAWVRDLLGRYAGDPRIAAVELRNELDPGDASAVAWARVLLPYVRTVLPGVPVTLSVSAHDPVDRLATLSRELAPVAPDFWSLHYYDKPEYALWTIAAARAAVAPVPIVVGETGYEPNLSAAAPRSRDDLAAEQTRYFRTLANATALLGLPPPGVWALLDFAAGASPLPMPRGEYGFGLFRVDGSAKPDAQVVRSVFATPGQVDAGFDGGFEQPGLGPWRAHGAGVSRDTAAARSGAGSAALAPDGGRAALTTIPPAPWVTAGQTATLTAWACGSSATGTTRVAIRWFAADGSPLGDAGSAPLPPGSTGWTQLTVAAPAPAGAAYLGLALTSEGNAGSARFDDVALAVG